MIVWNTEQNKNIDLIIYNTKINGFKTFDGLNW